MKGRPWVSFGIGCIACIGWGVGGAAVIDDVPGWAGKAPQAVVLVVVGVWLVGVIWLLRQARVVWARSGRLMRCMLLAVITGACCVQVYGSRLMRLPPSDEALMAAFVEAGPVLDELVAMTVADMATGRPGALFFIDAKEGSRGEYELSGSRVMGYAERLGSVGSRSVSGFYPGGPLMFVMWRRGIMFGQSKGYLYARGLPSGITEVSDTSDARRGHGVVCRHIQGGWYVYYSQ